MAAVIDDSVTIDLSAIEPTLIFGLTPLQLLLIGGAVAVAGLAVALTFR